MRGHKSRFAPTRDSIHGREGREMTLKDLSDVVRLLCERRVVWEATSTILEHAVGNLILGEGAKRVDPVVADAVRKLQRVRV